MSVFNINSLDFNNINESTGPILDDNTRSFSDESYFDSTCGFLADINEEFGNNTKILYRSILESDDNNIVINEAFDDFFSKVKEIIDKIIEFIRSLVNRFITSLHKFFGSDKYIIKHKKDFDKFKKEHEFSFIGYNYTIKPDVPSITPLETFNDEFVYGSHEAGDTLREKFKKINDKNIKDNDYKDNSTEVMAAMEEYYNDLIRDLENDYYDKFRARVLGRDKPIEYSDYADELFIEYRDGTSDTEEIQANALYVKKCLAEFIDNNKIIDDVKKYRKSVEDEYTKLKKNIKSMQEKTYKNGNSFMSITLGDNDDPVYISYNDNRLINIINTWLKAKVNQVQEISNIHTLAFSAKLDAITARFRQDKSVLYKALNNIQKVSTNESCTGKDCPERVCLSGNIMITDKLLEEPLPVDTEVKYINHSRYESIFKDLELK